MLREANAYQLERDQVVGALAQLRQSWERVAEDEGCSLIDISGSVGLILGEVVLLLNLSSSEQRMVLGDQLRKDFLKVLRTSKR